MAISYETQRLKVVEAVGGLAFSERSVLLVRIPKILTPPVVKNLPSHFHGVASSELAEVWLDRLLSESRLLLVQSEDLEIIGFLFAYVEDECSAHIGYLLAEESWGKGLATELLQGFIDEVARAEGWLKLVGGVDQSNVASAELLKKLGFLEQAADEDGTVIYEYAVPRSQS